MSKTCSRSQVPLADERVEESMSKLLRWLNLLLRILLVYSLPRLVPAGLIAVFLGQLT